jgi:hypothetical protein
MTVAFAARNARERDLQKAMPDDSTRWRRFAPINATVIDRRHA